MKFFQTRKDNSRYVQFAERLFGKSLKDATAEFEAIVENSGVQTRITGLGASEKDIDMLVDDVVRVSFGADGQLASSPSLTKEDIATIYRLAL